MKTKGLFILLFTFIMIALKPEYADTGDTGGELLFDVINTCSGRFNLSVSTSSFVWAWDKENSTVYLMNSYSRSLSNLAGYAFDSPIDINSAPDSIVWGLITFTIKSIGDSQGRGDFSFTFTLDLRDEDWNHNQAKYPGSDTHFKIDQLNKEVYWARGGTGNIRMRNNANYTIWDIWYVGSPLQTNFTIPIILKNRVENQNFDFGYIVANNQQISSGDPALYQFNTAKNANVGTTQYTYSGQRQYNFQWGYSNNLTPNTNTNFYNNQFNFEVNYNPDPKSITRYFHPVYPLTIKNSLYELNGISAGNIYFKDPTTTNAYELESAADIGFYKDNAFDSLSILIGTSPEQKYGAKAVSTINYNNRNYNYFEGDFSTTGDDFLVTSAKTMTAHYKGNLISNDATAYSNSSQRKFIQTPDGVKHICYESMDRVWYELSTDGGTTWIIGNGGKPLSNVNSKKPSMSFYGNIIAIVWQEQSTSSFKIKIALFWMSDYSSSLFGTVADEDAGLDYSYNANPVIAWGYNGESCRCLVWFQ